jgi:hypothetical protein
MYEFPHKKFYFCQNEFTFIEMPEIFMPHSDYANNYNGYFTGDPNTVLQALEKKEEEDKKDEDKKDEDPDKKDDSKKEDVEVKPVLPLRDFKEIHRLSFTVRAIENDCHICPEGAFKLTPTHEVRRNKNFQGISISRAWF